MTKHLALYRTYVIRCWEEPRSQAGISIYRFSLEIPVTGERFGFTCSEDLINALETALAQIQVQVSTETEDEAN
ncbi:MAG TPA: hypothetical protein V6C65_26035 [Allocoleopsis sp.]